MISLRVKRLFFSLFFLVVVLLVVAGIYVYLLTRDPGVSWENPNTVDANTFRRRIKLYTNSVVAGKPGYVRLSQIEINSYIKSTLTNYLGDTNAPGLHLTRAGVDLTSTNFTLYSWGRYNVLKYGAPLMVQRSYHVEQDGTNQWAFHLKSLRIGQVEIPARIWQHVMPRVELLDGPLREVFPWSSNVPAMLITRNELSERPELRLYTYKPIPPEDLH